MLYIYDAKYNLKTPTDYEKLEGITGVKRVYLRWYKCKLQKIPTLDNCYIIDDDTPQRQLWQWYDKVELHNETWKEIDDTYILSNYGRVKNMRYKKHPNGKFVYPHMKIDHGRKIPCAWLHKKEYRLKSLVAKLFVDNPHGYVHVINKNGLSHDIYHGNLEYCSRKKIASMAATRRANGDKGIVAYDLDGNVIDVYDNASRAGRDLFVSYQTVLNNLNGKTKLACGMYKFEWEA